MSIARHHHQLRLTSHPSRATTAHDLFGCNHRPRRPAADVRHHLASGCWQDDADREAAAVRRGHPARGRGARQGQPAPDPVGLDGHREGAWHLGRHLGDDVRIRRLRLQPAGYAGPRGLFGGHLSHADGGGFGDHGARRRARYRGAHAKAVRGMPAARYSHRYLHQQARPRDARPVRAARRDREDPGAGRGAGHLAARAGPGLRRHL